MVGTKFLAELNSPTRYFLYLLPIPTSLLLSPPPPQAIPTNRPCCGLLWAQFYPHATPLHPALGPSSILPLISTCCSYTIHLSARGGCTHQAHSRSSMKMVPCSGLHPSKDKKGQVFVTHACNPSCLGGWDQEDHGSRPTQANSLK
jgi:hypothetical protein